MSEREGSDIDPRNPRIDRGFAATNKTEGVDPNSLGFRLMRLIARLRQAQNGVPTSDTNVVASGQGDVRIGGDADGAFIVTDTETNHSGGRAGGRVEIGGNANGAMIITGNNNRVNRR